MLVFALNVDGILIKIIRLRRGARPRLDSDFIPIMSMEISRFSRKMAQDARKALKNSTHNLIIVENFLCAFDLVT